MDLERLIKGIQNKRGEDRVFIAGGALQCPRIPTGIPSLDYILGGGIPQGRMIELFGSEGSGKSTLALHASARVTERNGVVLYVDAEHGSFDPHYASGVGVDLKRTIVSQPNTAEEAFNVMRDFVDMWEEKFPALVVLDSVAALSPEEEFESDVRKQTIGLLARFLTKALRQMIPRLDAKGIVLIGINQLREKVGVFGSTETTPGGRALKHFSSIRLRVESCGAIKTSEGVEGHRLEVVAVKNKVASPFRRTELRLIYGQGIDLKSDLLDFAVSKGVISEAGGWYTWRDKKWRRRELLEALEDETIQKELRRLLES